MEGLSSQQAICSGMSRSFERPGAGWRPPSVKALNALLRNWWLNSDYNFSQTFVYGRLLTKSFKKLRETSLVFLPLINRHCLLFSMSFDSLLISAFLPLWVIGLLKKENNKLLKYIYDNTVNSYCSVKETAWVKVMLQ